MSNDLRHFYCLMSYTRSVNENMYSYICIKQAFIVFAEMNLIQHFKHSNHLNVDCTYCRKYNFNNDLSRTSHASRHFFLCSSVIPSYDYVTDSPVSTDTPASKNDNPNYECLLPSVSFFNSAIVYPSRELPRKYTANTGTANSCPFSLWTKTIVPTYGYKVKIITKLLLF